MKKSYFLVSKPLHYINATNIPDDTPKVCVFINNMANGSSIFQELKKKSGHWAELLFFETRMDALKELIQIDHLIEHLYLDTDYGFVIQYQLSKIKAKLFVYEEGIGTYRKFIRNKSFLNQLISAANLLLGNHDYIGGYKHTRGVYLYDETRHKLQIERFNKPRLKFSKPFLAHIKALTEIDVFFPNAVREQLAYLQHQSVVIYLTGWKIRQEILDRLKTYVNHVKILKPHPNLKDITEPEGIDEVIDGYILFELLLLYLVEICEEVIVFHEGSSFVQYVENYQNLKLIHVDNPSNDY